jgi:hypothetical protein
MSVQRAIRQTMGDMIIKANERTLEIKRQLMQQVFGLLTRGLRLVA